MLSRHARLQQRPRQVKRQHEDAYERRPRQPHHDQYDRDLHLQKAFVRPLEEGGIVPCAFARCGARSLPGFGIDDRHAPLSAQRKKSFSGSNRT